ncbi:MAG TPA: YqeG family HAD IIIA-type phosphatase [Fimbriimonadaceae bacterium]|nr:YqeG family HAD IIIA-type phosphatase [Fimbriimonadaceae bacterium]
MSSWRTGDFDRTQVPEVFHRFVPAHAANSLQDIDLDRLWSGGKRLILLDVDHTIVKWRAEEFSPEVLAWIERAKQMGFGLCIISNTRRVERLGRLSQKLGVETVRGKFKPSRAMFRLALIKFKRKPEEAVMIGDQLITDILGANRSGIDAIWVRKMEGKEFAGTKVNRFFERLLQSAIYKALIMPADAEPDAPAVEEAKPIAERTIVKQIVRFGIVGGTSFVIDTGLTYLFMRGISVHGTLVSESLGNWLLQSFSLVKMYARDVTGASAPILGGLASFVAMFNSFIWNRSWTFEHRGKEERLSHLRRFYAVSVLGAILNAIIFSLIFNSLRAHPNQAIAIAKVGAAFIVAVWNFVGQRYYAFRPSTRHAQ